MKTEKILINIENLEDLYEYKKIGYNNFLFAVNNLSIGYNSFDIDELKKIDSNIYLLMNKVLSNADIDELYRIKDNLSVFKGVIFEDIAVYNVLKEMDILLIWNQAHFATNYSSINYWLELVDSALISNELTKEEVLDILNRVNKPVILNVFGKNPIMYSRRTLLSNFNKYYNLKTSNNMILSEKISNSEFLAKESKCGTILFNNMYFNIINYVSKFNDNNILFYLIYPNGLSFKEIIDVINNKSNVIYDDGFMNKKTIYKLGGKV